VLPVAPNRRAIICTAVLAPAWLLPLTAQAPDLADPSTLTETAPETYRARQGHECLIAEFPKLDYIKKAPIVR
jgi:hypothetical protein